MLVALAFTLCGTALEEILDPRLQGQARMSLLEVRDLHVTYAAGRPGARAGGARSGHRRSTSGETLGLAGESGCGKSSLAGALLRLLPQGAPRSPARCCSTVRTCFEMKPGRLRAVRWTELAIVFQGALHTLNPVQRVGDQIAEAIRLHAKRRRAQASRSAWASCSSSWACPRGARAPTRTSSRAASASAC